MKEGMDVKRMMVLAMVLVVSLASGCASMNNIEKQRRIHKASHPMPIRVTNMNDGTPAVGFELTSLSAWEAMATNKPAAIWAGVKDGGIAAALIYLGVELTKSDGDSDKNKTPANLNNSTYVNNQGGNVNINNTDSTGNGKPDSSGTGINNSTVVNNGAGNVNVNNDYSNPPLPEE